MKQWKWVSVLWWIGSSLLAGATAFLVHWIAADSWWSLDLGVALFLLAFNHAMFGVAAALRTRSTPSMGLLGGLLWIVAKLFVNTFTIFLLIGLQAVRSPVFVPVFFIAYAVVLFLGILRLNHSPTPDRNPI